jgi:hypothetical protein
MNYTYRIRNKIGGRAPDCDYQRAGTSLRTAQDRIRTKDIYTYFLLMME